MNKKELSEYLQTLAVKLKEENQDLTIEEAQSLIGMTVKRMAAKIITLATPASITEKT